MARGEPLFSKIDFGALLRNIPAQLTTAIDELSDERLFAPDQSKLVDDLVARFTASVPVLDLASVVPSQKEVNLDARTDPTRFVPAGSRPVYIKATEVSFRVPYKGDEGIFLCRPSAFSLNPPHAEVEPGAVIIRIVRDDQNAAEYRKEFDRRIAVIQEYLDRLLNESAGQKAALMDVAIAQLAKRRQKRERDRNLIEQLGFGKTSSED